MTYELAKKLEDAGFLSAEGQTIHDWVSDPINGLHYTVPTLDELIQGCGNGFSVLVRKDEVTWYADQEFGSTPEEAVAMLWLALNKDAKR